MSKSYEIWNGSGWDALDGEPDRTVLEALSSYDEATCFRDGDKWTLSQTEDGEPTREGCYVIREVKARRNG